ncbi:hypothetical protein BT96DRAFT_942877 [Gymnopus androsaceus JB14]|uniref:Uncharacterized protein n=1 Tax=Gymnopus androsaceus JB14 TaxID=1447944 RepID=A0A6A4H9F2_9AGAR|nr:hypothetical protein BT96DRAFT_942877 [Gymnopus androsaceus JB14]
MKAIFFASAFATLISSAYSALTINTPASLVECEPVSITWDGGIGPFDLSVFPAGSPNTIVENLGEVNGNSFTWLVNLPAGQPVGFSVVDSTGAVAESASEVIQSGSSTACAAK